MTFRNFAFLGITYLASLLTSPVHGAVIQFALNVEFSGGTEPVGARPWVLATFDDRFGGSDTVRLTVDAKNLTGGERVKEFLFNFDPALNATDLSFNIVSNPTDLTLGDIDTTNDPFDNKFKAAGDGYFDVMFDFPQQGNKNRFTGGEQFVVDITRSGFLLSASDFAFQSVGGGGNGTFFAAAHVQNIDPRGDSGWIGAPIPEPTTVAMFLGGLLALVLVRVRSRKQVR